MERTGTVFNTPKQTSMKNYLHTCLIICNIWSFYYSKSNLSRFITLVQAATKSFTNLTLLSSQA